MLHQSSSDGNRFTGSSASFTADVIFVCDRAPHRKGASPRRVSPHSPSLRNSSSNLLNAVLSVRETNAKFPPALTCTCAPFGVPASAGFGPRTTCSSDGHIVGVIATFTKGSLVTQRNSPKSLQTFSASVSDSVSPFQRDKISR